jgi:Beta-lactamase enzyme family
MPSASIIKVLIAEVLLARSTPALIRTPEITNQLAPMLEFSSNSAASTLWSAEGSAPGITKFGDEIGLTETVSSSCVECPGFAWPGWGLTTTTPIDQLKVLENLVLPSTTLSANAQGQILSLMANVTPSEHWGISAGPPPTSQVWLKNGWLPISGTTEWQINSVGVVMATRHEYLVALLSSNNPTMDYGITTLEALSRGIWDAVSRDQAGS